MGIYIIILFVLSFFSFIRKEIKIKKLLILVLTLFLCFSYEMGSDWNSYYNIYKKVNISGLYTYGYEKGFYIYTYILKNVLNNFWIYYVGTKLLIIITFFKLFKYFLKKDNLLIIMLFYVQIGIYLFIDCPLRNLIAIGLSNLALLKLLKKDQISYLVLTLIGVLFHKTIVITFINYFIVNFFKIQKKKYIYGSIVILLIFFQQDLILKVIINVGDVIPVVRERLLSHYLNTERFQEQGINIVYIEKLLLLLYGIKNKEKLEYQFKKLGVVALHLSVVYFYLYHISRKIPILFRFSLYYKIFPLILLVLLIKIMSKEKRIIVKICYILYSLLMLVQMLKNAQEFLLPYKFIIG